MLYIPLCLYSNVSAGNITGSDITFTFHYVSILMSEIRFSASAISAFTFHYVSILIPSRLHNTRRHTALYIPLCLYSNLCRKGHHGSVLQLYIPLCLYSNEVCTPGNEAGSRLYIPLCLYSNCRDRRKQQRDHDLYIPLCLYSNTSIKPCPKP